jgi:hypothetical protein
MFRIIYTSIPCALILIFFLIGCSKADNKKPLAGKIFTDDFTAGTDGWIADFADFPTDPSQTPEYQLEFIHTVLPEPLNTSDGALKQSGINRSDDLFMFIKKKITGLEPDRNYTVDLKVDFASNVADNMIGVGGSPGEGVTIKAGVVSIEPIKIVNTVESWYRMNIDKSNQSESGMDMKVIGNFANGTDLNVYTIKQLSTSTPLNVKANQQGEIWLIIGTDSGFEAKTTIFYNSIQVTIK